MATKKAIGEKANGYRLSAIGQMKRAIGKMKKAIGYRLSAISKNSGRRLTADSRQPRSLSPRLRRQPRQRRGVILLVAMALLALFSVVVLTFVIVARQHKQSAEATLQGKYYDINYEEHLNQAALQVIRGTNNRLSVMGPHSLLEDLYGNGPSGQGSTTGTATVAVVGGSNNQLYTLTLTPSPTVTIDGYYNGRVITLSKGGRTESYRVVHYNGATGAMTVITNGEYTPDNFTALPPSGNAPDFVLNGRAFAGPGFGFNPGNFSNFAPGDDLLNYDAEPLTTDVNGNGLWDTGDAYTDTNGNGMWDAGIALAPNPTVWRYRQYMQGQDATGAAGFPFPIANEDYDAADYQNMLLAFQPAVEDLPTQTVTPSLHRRALINFWMTRDGAATFAALSPARKRQISLRPNSDDHPNSTVFTAGFNPVTGPWDVDNDADGQFDSIWVDLGLPVQTARDGKQYKPLFAILCLDMDGRLNVNEHGTLNDWNNDFAEGVGSSYYTNPFYQLTNLNRPANIVPPAVPEMAGTAAIVGRARLPVGQGYGPHEISLSPTLSSSGSPGAYVALVDDAQFRQLKRGARLGGVPVEGVYGEGYLLPAGADTTSAPAILAGTTGSNDNNPSSVATFGSPPDLDGGGVLGIGPDGQPRFTYMGTVNGQNSVPEATDEASELDPTRRRRYQTGASLLANSDNRFSPTELEALLRQSDADASTLPNRLATLAPNLFTGLGTNPNYNRARVTTESWDIPVPSFTPTPEIAYGLQVYNTVLTPVAGTIDYSSLSFLDLVRGKIVAVDRQGPSAITTKAQVDTYISTLAGQGVFAPELLRGQRMNLNRPFGASGTDITAKRIFATQLYFLMLLLKDNRYSDYINTGVFTAEVPAATVRAETTARQLAQWAINVVEFRDPDLTLTSFEYVLNPFKYDPTAMPADRGWNVDGNIATDETDTMAYPPASSALYNANRRVVWGCEEPVLLLTETNAFHDRRVEDLMDGGGRLTDDTNSDMSPDDTTMDQRRMPQGSAFFELYCTRNPGNPVTPSQDLFSGNNLDLGKMSGGNPVWRLAISDTRFASPNNNVTQRLRDRPFSASLDPANFNHIPSAAEPVVTIDRIVWFAAPAAAPSSTTSPPVYYNRAASGSNVHVPGGTHVVVGPSRTTATAARQNDNVTFLGWKAAAPAPQEIQLSGTFHVSDNAGTATATAYPLAEAKPAMGIAVGADHFDPMWALGPVGISISEPKPRAGQNYYPNIPSPNASNQTVYALNGNATVNDVYSPVLGTPLDTTASIGVSSLATGTTENIRTVFLQRLADPTLPYNAVTNPYISVDWLPIDLTVFNGQSNPPTIAAPANPLDGHDPDDPNRGTAPAVVKFGTRQKGFPRTAGSDSRNELWTAVSENFGPSSPVTAGAPGSPPPGGNFTATKNLYHTLGFINEPFQDVSIAGTWKFLTDTNAYGMAYRGSPGKPYPWLTWTNSPYISQYQLMQVPSSSPSRLGWEFCTHDIARNSQGFYNDQTDARSVDGDRNGIPLLGTPFGHLLNFFHSSDYNAPWNSPNTGANLHNQAASNYYRIFDYVETPSLFSGTRMPLTPSSLPAPYNASLPLEGLSTYRTPGLVNINTINDTENRAWMGITNSFNSVDYPGAPTVANPLAFADGNATWTTVRNSRQGFGGAINNPSYPTNFARPFRSAGSSTYVPLASMRTVGGDQLINSTLLRRTSAALPDDPLFSFVSRDGTPGYDNGQLDSDGDGTPDVVPIRGHFNNSDYNPYYRYLMYQKMGNILTTRSNVYAVWVTVGYFEVQRTNVDEGNPDGYELLGELTDNDGNNVPRHKAFFLIDRSIPVAFSRGENHNVHRALLVHRIVE